MYVHVSMSITDVGAVSWIDGMHMHRRPILSGVQSFEKSQIERLLYSSMYSVDKLVESFSCQTTSAD